jgi:hypothetical protein
MIAMRSPLTADARSRSSVIAQTTLAVDQS